MTYYLGVDGGGTKTKVCIIDQDDRVLFMGQSGPSSIDTVKKDDTIAAIDHAYQPWMNQHPNIMLDAIFIGVGGIVSLEDCRQVESWALSLQGVGKNTLIQARNYMENALSSGLLFDEGIALICGTGSVAFGKNKQGQTHKAGGWSFKEGDLGSAYDLGMRALRHVIQAFDGRDQKTAFSVAVADAIQMKDEVDFFHIIQDKYLDRTWIASLAPIVTSYAIQGDLVATTIVDHATYELAKAVRAVQKRLNLIHPNLVIVGSLGHAEGYQDKLHEHLKNLIPGIHILSPKLDPAEAAARMAKHLSRSTSHQSS